MFVYAGIDEAGYGPMFGPLVIARSVFVLDHQESFLQPPSLWSLLRPAVCRKPGDKKNRLAVDDSKKLYKPAWSLKHIERGVLSFLSAAGIDVSNLEHLLERLALDRLSFDIRCDWYQNADGDPPIPLFPAFSQIEKTKIRLLREMRGKSVYLSGIKAAVIFEDRFNQMVQDMGSKAGCAWYFVSGHLTALWQQYGEYHPFVAVDRQGGRKNYLENLKAVFPQAEVAALFEEAKQSCYSITQASRAMRVLVQVESERRHFPVALSSMTAKYLRELLMTRFQKYWASLAPQVKPTFGYFGDGRRFLKDIQPLITELNIDPDSLIRRC